MSKPKKVILVVLTISLPFILFFAFVFLYASRIRKTIDLYHPSQYKGWKDVSISENYSFSIPNEWTATINDKTLYITDKSMEEENYTIYMVGMMDAHYTSDVFLDLLSDLYDGTATWFAHDQYKNDNGVGFYTEDFERKGGRLFSNSAYYQPNNIYRIDDNFILIDLITFSHHFLPEDSENFEIVEIVIIVDTDIVNDDLIDKIAKSFRHWWN